MSNGEYSVIKFNKFTALHTDVIVTDMDFGETATKSGIILRSDNGKSHGVKPRWGRIYAVGPEQTEVKVGEWILIEHGRWTRAFNVDDGNGQREIFKVDLNGVIAVSDERPDDIMVGDSV